MRFLTLTLVVALTAVATAQKKPDLPPLSYVCVMMGDEDVIEDKPGKCPKCGMTLVPIRLVSVFTCASKPGLGVQETPGKCPVDGTPLERMTMAVSWTCPGVATESTGPGVCRDGTPMKAVYKLRPHGNHNPQHGGQFFMAPDNWHHLEGTYPRAGAFRMYLYDDYTRPLARAKAKDVQGHVIVKGQTFPLTLAVNGRYLEAKLAGINLPAAVEANVKFTPDGKSNVFDFNFTEFSKEPVAGAPVLTKASPTPNPTLATPAAPTATPSTPAATTTPATSVDAALAQLPIPDTVPEMLKQLQARTDQIRMLIDKGLFADMYVPAFQAKDVALALEAHQADLPAPKRVVSEAGIAKLVRAAYMLDAFGDLGNKQQISAAFDQFALASKDILSAFPQ
jgi:hypothetical protein